MIFRFKRYKDSAKVRSQLPLQDMLSRILEIASFPVKCTLTLNSQISDPPYKHMYLTLIGNIWYLKWISRYIYTLNKTGEAYISMIWSEEVLLAKYFQVFL